MNIRKELTTRVNEEYKDKDKALERFNELIEMYGSANLKEIPDKEGTPVYHLWVTEVQFKGGMYI